MYKKILIVVFTVILASTVNAADSAGFNKVGENVKIVITPSMGSPCDDQISYNDSFIAAKDTPMFALVSSGSAFGSRITNVSCDYTMELKQGLNNNRFLLTFTNATAQNIENKASFLDNQEIPETRFGELFYTIPTSFRIYLRLAYETLNLVNRIRLIAGATDLIVQNTGKDYRDLTQIRFERKS